MLAVAQLKCLSIKIAFTNCHSFLNSFPFRRGLIIHEITSDGDCLYNSVAHQLKIVSGVTINAAELRRNVADILRRNRDDFLPFLPNPKTGLPLSEVEFEKYCQDLVEKPVWGGQVNTLSFTSYLSYVYTRFMSQLCSFTTLFRIFLNVITS